MPEARLRGYKPGRFSFNVKGGRCEACEGAGIVQIEMHFLPDVYVQCEVCKGKRYNRETLEIHYKGRNVAEILEMTVDEALGFFSAVPSIRNKLQTLHDVGMGYIHLGQPATTLSGGEAQRVKLATELSKRATGQTLYILDEPTTGLHFDDVARLLEVLGRLVDAGNTVVVIEHNLDVIKSADWVIDLGPEGGAAGGDLVAAGTPEEVARTPGLVHRALPAPGARDERSAAGPTDATPRAGGGGEPGHSRTAARIIRARIRSHRIDGGSTGMPTAALVVIGVVLVFLGILRRRLAASHRARPRLADRGRRTPDDGPRGSPDADARRGAGAAPRVERQPVAAQARPARRGRSPRLRGRRRDGSRDRRALGDRRACSMTWTTSASPTPSTHGAVGGRGDGGARLPGRGGPGGADPQRRTWHPADEPARSPRLRLRRDGRLPGGGRPHATRRAPWPMSSRPTSESG